MRCRFCGFEQGGWTADPARGCQPDGGQHEFNADDCHQASPTTREATAVAAILADYESRR